MGDYFVILSFFLLKTYVDLFIIFCTWYIIYNVDFLSVIGKMDASFPQSTNSIPTI